MDILTSLSLFVDWKSDIYTTILEVVNCLIKIVHYEPVKTIIDLAGLAKVIIDVVVRRHSLLESISCNRGSLFTLKFLFLLYYFFDM